MKPETAESVTKSLRVAQARSIDRFPAEKLVEVVRRILARGPGLRHVLDARLLELALETVVISKN